MRRIEVLLGRSLDEIDSHDLTKLVSLRAVEDVDLEFKAGIYGVTDQDKRALAGDVAAMANTVGGVLIIGVSEAEGVASQLTPVDIREEEVLRMRQTITANVAPVPQFDIRRVPEVPGTATGFFLISISRSPDAPHAIRVNDGLRYPRRDGARIRWLAESEVADAYRARFVGAESRVASLQSVNRRGIRALETSNNGWLTLSLVPIVAGSMGINQRTIQEAKRDWIAAPASRSFVTTVFPAGGFDVAAGVRRVIIAGGRDRATHLSTTGHCELYQDGSGFAAVHVWTASIEQQHAAVALSEEWLVGGLVSAIGLLVDHAVRRTRTIGDAIAELSIAGPRERSYTLGSRRSGFLNTTDSVQLADWEVFEHQLSLAESLTGPGCLVVARLLLTDAFQAFGLAEVPQITPSGQLRKRYFDHYYQASVEAWAASRGAAVVDSTLETEAFA